MSLALLLPVAFVGAVTGWFEGLAEDAAAYGYPAVALVVAADGVFPAFPGETAVVAAAVLAAAGDLSLVLVIAAGTVGAVMGDWTAYWIGRAGGGPIKRAVARVAGAERLAAAEGMVQRRGPVLVFVGRFLPGLRIAINMSCGAGQMRFLRFVVFNALGAVVWATQAALLGYFAGKAFADQIWVAFVVAIAVTLAAGGAIAIIERKRMRRERERRARESADAAAAPTELSEAER